MTPSNPEDTGENPISWDFIVRLLSSAVPHMPQCVKRVANMYDLTRNRKFLRVTRDKQKDKDILVYRTDDFISYFDRTKNKKHCIGVLSIISIKQEVERLEKGKDLLNDPEYATEIENALDYLENTLLGVRKGNLEINSM